MSITKLLSELRLKGIQLFLDNGQIRCRGPKGVFTPELRNQLADNKDKIIMVLRDELSGANPLTPTDLSEEASNYAADVNWPPECLKAEKRFEQSHARLFPFLGCMVLIPSGRGVLVQVFAQRVAVNVSGRIVFLLPEQVRPLTRDIATAA